MSDAETRTVVIAAEPLAVLADEALF